MILRPYQDRTVRWARYRIAQGSKAVLIVAPTGAGKTIIGAEIARRADGRGRVLWIAHRHELVEQARSKLPEGVAVETIQSLASSGRRPGADVVVLDEAHHFVADQWGAVAADYRDSYLIGLTATPERADGRPLGDLFTSLVVAAHYSELLAGGWLVDCDVYAPRKGKTLAMTPAEAHAKYGGRSLVFCRTVNEADKAAAEIEGAVSIDADTPAEERALAVQRFRGGTLDCLCNVYVLSEGFDAPGARTCILARGTGHPSTYLQMVGRVLRPDPGKAKAMLVDLVGSYHDHGHPLEDRVYSLEGKAISRKPKAEPLWQCKDCGFCLRTAPAGRVCPSCGEMMPEPEELVVARRKVYQQEALKRHGEEAKRGKYEELRQKARDRGYKDGWAEIQFKIRYGYWPPKRWRTTGEGYPPADHAGDV